MPLVRDSRIVDDHFIRIDDHAGMPETGAVIVSGGRYLADAAALSKRAQPTGVVWPNDRPVTELAPHVGNLALIALVFPRFRDGRAFSQARLLRERYGYSGELRATGEVLRDQFLFMLRAGFDSFEVPKPADALAFAEAVKRYDVFYQPTGDGRITALRHRLGQVLQHA
jgi:uncharacterized protein (DUF934 family)